MSGKKPKEINFMKKIIFVVLLLIVSCAANAQYKWTSVSYYHNSGAVTPEFQYNYIIQINTEGASKLEYTKNGKTNTFEFNAGKKGLKTLDNSLSKTKLLSEKIDTVSDEKNLIGGSISSATIFLIKPEGWKKRKSPVIMIPNANNFKNSAEISDMFQTMEKLVPDHIWKEAMEQN